jgi:DNA-directed RNA polymerase specialized sigma24 family protein
MSDEPNYLDELVRLKVLEVRRGLDSQNAAILELDRAGFGANRIAELIGTSPATVRNAIARAKTSKTD